MKMWYEFSYGSERYAASSNKGSMKISTELSLEGLKEVLGFLRRDVGTLLIGFMLKIRT